jgi:hypothetical protein
LTSITRTLWSRSKVERASRSSRVTISVSPLLQDIKSLGQLGPVGACATHGFLEDQIAPIRAELFKLRIEGLAGGGNASVGDRFHAPIMHAIYARANRLKSFINEKRAEI